MAAAGSEAREVADARKPPHDAAAARKLAIGQTLMVALPGRAAFVSLIIWFVIAANRYVVAPSARVNFGSFGETMLIWLVAAIVGLGGTFFYLMARVANPPLAAARFGVYAVVLKALFDLGLASSLEKQAGPSPRELILSTEYWMEMVILVVVAYLAGQIFVRVRARVP